MFSVFLTHNPFTPLEIYADNMVIVDGCLEFYEEGVLIANFTMHSYLYVLKEKDVESPIS